MLNNLIKRRIELGIKQKDIAIFLGYNKSSYSNIENGNRCINTDILSILAYILDMDMLSILDIIPYYRKLDNTSKYYIKLKYNLDDTKISKLYNKDVYDIRK